MAILAQVGDNDVVNNGIVCCIYPPDVITLSSATCISPNVFINGVNPLLSGPDSLLTTVQGVWTCPPPVPTLGCPPQLRRLNSLVNLNVYANGKLITCVGDSTEGDGFTKRVITGPGIVGTNVFIG